MCLDRRLVLLIAATVALQSAAIAFELLLPVLYGRLIDGGLLVGDASHTLTIGLWMLLAVVAQAVVAYGAVRLVALATIAVGTTLRRRLVDGIVAGENHAELEAGGMVTRASRDVMQIQALVSTALSSWYASAALSVFGLVTLFLIAPKAAPLAGAFAVAFAIAGYHFARRMAPRMRTILGVSDRVNTAFSDRIRGSRTLRVLPRFGPVVDPFTSLNKRLRDEELGLGRVLALVVPTSTVITAAGAVAVIAAGATAVHTGSMQVGHLSASITIFLQVLFGLSALLASIMSLPIYLASVDRVHGVVGDGDDEPPGETPSTENRGHALTLEKVTVVDPATGRLALDIPALEIPAGSRVGITGPMGAGKSLLARTIAGLVSPHGGRVTATAASTGEVARPLTICGYQGQDPYLTTGTIRTNLCPGDAIAEPGQALRIAAIDHLVDQRGLDAPVTGGGAEFSGGERQRLALAAALHQSRGLVVLDEPVSAVDPATRTRIADDLFDGEHGTVLVATTDAEILARCDSVVFLERGSVIDVAPHRDLLDRHDDYRLLVGARESQS
nr:ABC transporter ATP-binding protein [Gordonia araii]